MKTDERVLTLLNKVRTMKAEIKSAQRPSWETNCSFGYVEKSAVDRINLQVSTNLHELINIVGFLNQKEEAFNSGAKLLGLFGLKFTWMGYPVKSWTDDIKARISYLQIDSKKKELEELEKRVDKLVSPEQRRELELAELESLIK